VQVKLNTKRIYQADGYAVKELIKVASVIYTAVQDSEASQSGGGQLLPSSSKDPEYVRIDTKELKETREKASQLVQKGVTLYDMLSKEVSLREARHAALSKAYEYNEVERLIKAAIESGAQEAKKMTSVIENVQSNLSSLESKMEKKQSELDRSQKRLLTLKKVRPAFMDEFEELQEELALTYKQYVDRFRSLAFLQNQIEEKHRVEMDRKAEERLSKADFGVAGGKRLLGSDDYLYGNPKGAFPLSSGSDEESSDEMEDPLGLTNTGVPPSTNSSGGRGDVGKFALNNKEGSYGRDFSNQRAGRQIYGSMLGGEEESEDESDMILVDGDNDNSDLGSEDDDELVKMQKTLDSNGTMSKMGKGPDTERTVNGTMNNGQHY
jgi:clusterin-associated protein 1